MCYNVIFKKWSLEQELLKLVITGQLKQKIIKQSSTQHLISTPLAT